MYQRLLMAILFGFLGVGAASAQESGVLYEPGRAKNPAYPGIRPQQSFRLKGVLISRFSRTALVNGRPVQEGDRIGGAEILAIGQRGIRIRVGVDELSVNVGGSFLAARSSGHVPRAAHGPARDRESPAAPSLTRPLSATSPMGGHMRHTVKQGETLSGIALRYRIDGVTIDQMMVALYRSNPRAFSGNINVLHGGADLRIPDENELHRQSPAAAAAEVARQTDRWQAANHQPVRVADTWRPQQYGPVESGETLSAIAVRISAEGVTTNQVMIALYEANPKAFGDNINVLHEGAVLRIPDENERRQQTPEMATAEVMRQTKAWQAGFERHAPSAADPAGIMASADGLMDRVH